MRRLHAQRLARHLTPRVAKLWESVFIQVRTVASRPLKGGGDLTALRHTAHTCLLTPDGASVLAATGHTMNAVDVSTGAGKWVYDLQGAFASSLLTTPDGATVVVATDHGQLHGVDAGAGTQKWSCELPDRSIPGPTSISPDGTRVLCGSGSGDILSISASSGKQVWSFKVGEAIPSNWSFHITPDGASIVFWAGDGKLHALDARTGEERWAYHQSGEPPSDWGLFGSPHGAAMLFATGDCRLHSLSAVGELRWSLELTSEIVPSSCLVKSDGSCILLGTERGNIISVSLSTGEQLWQCELGGAIPVSSTLSPDGSLIFVMASDGIIHALATGSGQVRWTCNPASTAYAFAVDVHGIATYVCIDGYLRAIASVSGETKWSHELPANVRSTLMVGPDGLTVFVKTSDERLRAIVAVSGEQRWVCKLPLTGESNEGAAQAQGKQRLSPSSLLRKKRMAVLVVLLIVLELRRSGRLKRPAGLSDSLADVLGEPLASLVYKVLGKSDKDAISQDSLKV